MALRAGAFPEKLGHSACSQPACAGKDWSITQPIGQRCTGDQPTIKGRTSANFGYSKPLFACVYRTFGDQFIAPARAIFFWTQRPFRWQKSVSASSTVRPNTAGAVADIRAGSGYHNRTTRPLAAVKDGQR